MPELKIPIRVAIIVLLILLLVSIQGFDFGTSRKGTLQVTFLDVGQGDATFIESPSGTQVLIDGGKGSAVLGPLGKVMGFFDRDIDMVVATHPDMDHIGGLIDVLERYDVATIVMTENISDTPVFEMFQERVRDEGARIIYVRRGQIFDLGSGDVGSTTLRILFPDRDPTNLESNMSSIVSQLVYGESEYLLMGDSPKEIEAYLVALDAENLESDVLKLGHHGSRTSTAEAFVRAVNPDYGIVSAGKDNSYGHPHTEVVERLQKYNVIQKNTADEGSIFSYSDGTSIWFK